MPADEKEAQIIRVYNHNQKRVIEMEISSYLTGVIAAEMPASFMMEALKAQAVASRTYTLKQLPRFGGNGSQQHPEADICTDYRYSQAWISEEEMKRKWGFLGFFYYWSRINRSVEDTRNEILVHKGQLIDAVYHSNAGGRTEDSAAVWQKQSPYLRSVESPYDREGRNFHREYSFTVAEFDKLLDTDLKDLISAQQPPGEKQLITPEKEGLFRILSQTNGGRIQEMKIGNKTFTGLELRELLDLSSTNIEPVLKDGKIILSVYGNGHGVGMSQEGADGYAAHGYQYHQILTHYYQGAEIINLDSL